MSSISLLYQLQILDLDLDQAQKRIMEIDQSLADTSEMELIQRRLDDMTTSLKEKQSRLGLIQDTIQARTIKAQTSEAALYGGRISNPKELKDLQDEIASHKNFIQETEDTLLGLMVETDQENQSLQKIESELFEKRKSKDEEQQALLMEKTTLIQRIISLNTESKAISGQIPKEVLESYRKLRAVKKGIAVARIQDESCSGCGSPLTKADIQVINSQSKIVYCQFCGRILFGD